MIKNILLNSGSNVAILFVKIALTFIMAPILIHNLGGYDYGLWEMLGAVIGYMGMLDMGMKPAISRFSAKYQAKNDHVNQQLLLSTAFAFMLFLGVILAITFTIWGLRFPDSIAQEGMETQRYTFLCLILAVQFLFVFPGYVAESILEGKQKYHIKNLVTLINSLIGSACIYVLITPENGLILLAGINAIGLSTKYVVYFYILRSKRFGSLKIFGTKPSKNKLKELMLFGGKSLIQGISSRIENATDSIVIGSILGPASVPFYSIPANLVAYIRTLSHTLTHVFMPVFSDISASNNPERLKNIYIQASKYVIGFVLMISLGVIVFGADFIEIWIGPEYSKNANLLIIILVLFITIPLLNPLDSRYLTAINKHSIFAKLTPISAIINLISSIILIQYLGVIGVAIGSLIPVIIFMPIYLNKCCAELGIKVTEYITKSIFPSIIPLILMGITIILLKQNFLIDDYFSLVMISALSSFIYLLSFYLLVLKIEEKNKIKIKIKNTLKFIF